MDYKFHLHATISELAALRTQFEAIFEQEQLFDDLTRKNILLALTELFVNVVKHGGVSESSKIEYSVHREMNGIEIEIRDRGNSYDPYNLPPPDISQLPENGYGVYLVKSLMDSFEYHPKSEESPNITRICKYV